MASSFTADEEASLLTEINTTPLIDVLLVLLIVLILAMPALTHRTVLETSTRPPANVVRPRILVEVEFDGSLYWNDVAVSDMSQLEGYLRSAAKENPQPEVVILANRNAKYDTVAVLLATAQRNGIARLGFSGQERFAD